MNRQKKKVNHSSDEDEQVSIFDSQQEENKEKKNNQKNQNHKIHKKAPPGRPAKNKPKKITAKTREKKLMKEENDIMKTLMGNKQEERSKESTQSEKKDNDEIRLDENNLILKKEYTYNNNNEWKEESNPYQEIPLMDEYSMSKENPSEPVGNKNQEYSQKINLASSNTPSYKYTNPYNTSYSQQHYIRPPFQQSYYLPPQTYNYYGYSNPYQPYTPMPSNFYPNIDPSIELTFEDFQQITFEDDKINDIDICQIEQLREQANQEKKSEVVSNQNKKDVNYRKRRMSYILSQIEKFRKQYIELQDLSAQKCENHISQPISMNILVKQWKYDPNLLKKPQKLKLQIIDSKNTQEQIPKSKTQGRITMLNELLTQNPFLTQVEMADVLRAMDPVMNARIERSVVLRLLKMCGFKKKKVRGVCKERNSSLSIALRCEYAHKYREYATQNFEMFYLDELIINEYFDKESGWCKAEDEIEYKPEKFIDRSVVVLCLMSSKGVCKYHARFGNYQPQEYCKIFNNMLRNVEGNYQKRLLIVNPLPYRDPKPITQILDKRAWEMLVLPSDGLGLNPLQSYFADIRDLMKRKRYDTVQTLFQSVVEVLQDVEKQGLAQKTLARVDIYVQKAMHRELL